MEFELDEDQRALRDSIERLLADHYDMAQRKRYQQEDGGWSRALWQRYAELGLLGLAIPAEHGGSECGPAETSMVAEALGHALILEPWLSTAVLGVEAIKRAGSAAQQQDLLPRIAAGELTIGWAHDEQHPSGVPGVYAMATRVPGGWQLVGAKHYVVHADSVDRLLVTARLVEGGKSEKLGLFLVDAKAQGLIRKDFLTHDGMHAAHLTLRGVQVGEADWLCSGAAAGTDTSDAAHVIETLIDHGIATLCAEAVGVMQEMLDRTVEYLKTRQQFGVAIGTFQALQHRAVDMLVALDAARSMSLYANAMLGEADPVERRRAMAATKYQVGKSARYVGQQTVQLHGGMGMTIETKAAQCFLRSSVIEQIFGATPTHLRTLARLGGLINADA